MHAELAPDRLLAGYAVGIFPMAGEDGELRWLAPDPRAIIELGGFKSTPPLRSAVPQGLFQLTVNRSFEGILDGCARRPEGTWISAEIHDAYATLHRMGFAHSVEAWKDGALAGGLYGVSIGGAFFGESMFYRVNNASKVAMVHLVHRLRAHGFLLLDVQFMTDHLRRFGAIEIPRLDYETRLTQAIRQPCSFAKPPEQTSGDHADDPAP